jgi:N-methylhydantoinase B/oxoprolinase/acetone carboxylase alpha subunit
MLVPPLDVDMLLEPGCFAALVLLNTKDLTSTRFGCGNAGTPGYNILDPGTVKHHEYHSVVASLGLLPVGTNFRTVTGGGGGSGPPLERDPNLVLADVENEFIDVSVAVPLHDVIVLSGSEWTLDPERNQRLCSKGASLA